MVSCNAAGMRLDGQSVTRIGLNSDRDAKTAKDDAMMPSVTLNMSAIAATNCKKSFKRRDTTRRANELSQNSLR